MTILQAAFPPVDSAFRAGELLMGSEVVRSAEALAPTWGSYPLNRALVIVAAFLVVLFIGEFYRCASDILKYADRWKWAFTIEESIPLARSRDACALLSVLPLTLVLDRFGVFALPFPTVIPESCGVVITFGILAAWFILRSIIYYLLSPSSGSSQKFATAKRTERNFVVLMTWMLLLVAGVLSAFNVGDAASRICIIIVLCISYIHFLVKKAQILGSFCAPLSTFLYLCALEIIPTALLVYLCMI